VISLGHAAFISTRRSFPVSEFRKQFVTSWFKRARRANVHDRWRWNATVRLPVPRFLAARKIAAPLQRMESKIFWPQFFPDQLACLEHIVGDARSRIIHW